MRQQRADLAQVAVQRGHVRAVVRDRLAEQVERALLDLQPGDSEVGTVDQQRERARSAAEVEHFGVPARFCKGGEQHAVLPELEKPVVLPQRQAVRQVFNGLRHNALLPGNRKGRPGRASLCGCGGYSPAIAP